MKKQSKKILNIILFILSALMILIFCIEQNEIHVNTILSELVKENPGIENSIISTYWEYDHFLWVYILDYCLLVLTLVLIPMCVKYKNKKASKIVISLITLISLAIIIDGLLAGYYVLGGYVSTFIFIYALIACILVYKK